MVKHNQNYMTCLVMYAKVTGHAHIDLIRDIINDSIEQSNMIVGFIVGT